MSNLGRYQDLTTAAKAHGGVEAYIKAIERSGAPKYGGLGFAVGVAATVAFAFVVAEVHERKVQAARAKQRLRRQSQDLAAMSQEYVDEVLRQRDES